ncbi:mechanosensitive ion channel [Promicromonospora kroppenstedtii]|uniref:mechanosensitive ion channel n=1 Tax=Promicromonospora kroppenstedtii TaxID=440482 RepID=UPI0004B48866|nr:mechanosensitive ion channel [Promicromonospora kroppenstedtii]
MNIAEDYDWAGILGTIAIVLVILVVTWLVARLVRWAVAKLVSRIGFLRRQGADGRDVGTSIGQIIALLIWLFGLIAVLQVLHLEQVLGPLQGMLETILGYLPNIIGAAVVFFIGYLIAKIVKQIIVAALGAVDFARLFGRARAAASRETGAEPQAGAESYDPETGQYSTPPVDNQVEARETNARIASVIANLVFAVIVVVVAIAALQILGIRSISEPAQEMLTLILGAIPAIIAALVILGIGYLIARFVADLLESVLQGVGTDRVVREAGITTGRTSPSTVIAKIAQAAILVFFAIMAAQLLNFPAITDILNEVLKLAGRVLFGGAIIAAGFFVATVIKRVVGEGTAATILRYGTIILFVAIGLQYMGLADSIINLAFGSIVVGAALAAALAYGMGGRDVAHRSLERLERRMEASPTRTSSAPQAPQTPQTPPTPPTPPTGSAY